MSNKSKLNKIILEKSPSGINGLDEITEGGLPKGRPTLICGSAGCGKTMFAMEFLVHGVEIGEPGVFVSFEETQEELEKNFASLGIDLKKLEEQKKFLVEYIYLREAKSKKQANMIWKDCSYGLNMQLNRLVLNEWLLDTIEALFSGLPNEFIIQIRTTQTL